MLKRRNSGQDVVKLLLTLEETAEALGIGRTSAYELVVKHRKIPSLMIGRCRRIPVDAVREFISQQLAS